MLANIPITQVDVTTNMAFGTVCAIIGAKRVRDLATTLQIENTRDLISEENNSDVA